jgi:hypothetical protein
MKRYWQFQDVFIRQNASGASIRKILNRQGEDGWEAVSMCPVGGPAGDIHVLMKRRVFERWDTVYGFRHHDGGGLEECTTDHCTNPIKYQAIERQVLPEREEPHFHPSLAFFFCEDCKEKLQDGESLVQSSIQCRVSDYKMEIIKHVVGYAEKDK